MRELSQDEESNMEQLIDSCGLANVLHSLASICDQKASHIETSYADRSTAREWKNATKAVTKAAESAPVSTVSNG